MAAQAGTGGCLSGKASVVVLAVADLGAVSYDAEQTACALSVVNHLGLPFGLETFFTGSGHSAV